MKKFDLIYEQLLDYVNEKNYVDAKFEDNVRLIVKVLKDNDYISSEKDVDEVVSKIMAQENNVKELTLDVTEEVMPPVKLHLTQDSDSEDFEVEVINLEDPEHPKKFENTMLETIFDEVVNYIKELSLKGLSADNAVDEMPQAEGPNAQPEGGESALPTGEELSAPEKQPLA